MQQRLRKALGHLHHDLCAYGPFKGVRMLWIKTRPRSTSLVRVHSHILNGSVLLRPGTSDPAMFDQFELEPYVPIPATEAPLRILDLGANIGLSVRYWKRFAPNAHIIAVEPDPQTFAVLETNVQGLAHVHLVQGGVWHHSTRLSMMREGVGAAAFQTVEGDGHGEIRAYTVQELLDRIGWIDIDIVKVDIEGSERELFGLGDLDWINRTRLIAVELHDRTRPGCGDAFFKAISGRSWKYTIRGEMIVCERQWPHPDPEPLTDPPHSS